LRLPPQGTVYVIDDHKAVRDAIRVLLEAEGFSVIDFASASEFLQCPREIGRGCIVTDVQMPGMNGLQLIEGVRGRDKSVPIIVITGHPVAAVRTAVEEAEAVLLVKPFAPAELVAHVSDALRGNMG
jgi:FixJ family two-component response regulator